jgi:uncharacterized protein
MTEWTNTVIPVDIGKRKPYPLEISHHHVPMKGLPPELEGVTVAQISDLHTGFGGLEAVYEEAIQRVNALAPDWIFFTGDYIDDSHKGNYPAAELLSRFCAKRGVYACFGNHDHRRGIVGSRRVLDQAGVPVLVNESREIAPGLWLAAVDDIEKGRPDLEQALAGLPDDRTVFFLSHNPQLIEIKKVQNRDLVMLSGHTHGGQINIPFIAPPQFVCWLHLRCFQVAGWYQYGKARLYVNRGVGVTGQPFRMNCPAEISFFHLQGSSGQ